MSRAVSQPHRKAAAEINERHRYAKELAQGAVEHAMLIWPVGAIRADQPCFVRRCGTDTDRGPTGPTRWPRRISAALPFGPFAVKETGT